jgi:hypothetical protein
MHAYQLKKHQRCEFYPGKRGSSRAIYMIDYLFNILHVNSPQ